MPVAVMQVQRKQEKDPLDTIIKGLSIASSIYGIKEASTKSELLKAQSEAQKAQQEKDNAFKEQDLQLKTRGLDIEEMKAKKPQAGSDPLVREMQYARLDEMNRKKQAEVDAKKTPFGMARTPDDAKQLKEAGELKSKLDSEIQELINLRKEYGGEMLNREAVSRAQQLSKSLLLTKKNLESLGVLSKSDEAIVNEIIPANPLQFNSSALWGEDPTMTKLTKFKEDTGRDFQERLKTRLNQATPQELAMQELIKRKGMAGSLKARK